MLTGRHLVAGQWVGGGAQFTNAPVSGEADSVKDAEQRMQIARTLMPVLERKAGRLLVNGFPTDVEVADTMVHGGP